MKLLHLTDFHANRRWFKWLADCAEEYDLIAYTGDFLDIFGSESLGAQIDWISASLRGLPRPFLFCPGNHDVETMRLPVASGRWMSKLPGAKAFSQSGRATRLGQNFVQIDWKGEIPALRRDDLILAHTPPIGCFTATSGELDHGDISLGDALRSLKASPLAVLSGHVHRPRRWADRCGTTISLNPGTDPFASIPNYIEIDTMRRLARLFREGSLADSIALNRERLTIGFLAGRLRRTCNCRLGD